MTTGDTGHDQPDLLSPPVKVGGRAYTGTPTAVANADRVNTWHDEYGRIAVFTPDPADDSLQEAVDATNSGATQLVAAVAGSVIAVTSIVITNAGASLLTAKLRSSTTDLSAYHALAANGGGYARTAPPGEYLHKTASGEALNLYLSAAGTVAADVTYKVI